MCPNCLGVWAIGVKSANGSKLNLECVTGLSHVISPATSCFKINIGGNICGNICDNIFGNICADIFVFVATFVAIFLTMFVAIFVLQGQEMLEASLEGK